MGILRIRYQEVPMNRSALVAIVAASGIVVAGVAVGATIAGQEAPAPSASSHSVPDPVAATPTVPATPSATTQPTVTQQQSLLYLIEEEKLAHDVYTVLGDLWGLPIFDDISSSETSHQALVEQLLVDRGIADPRTGVVGEFTDPVLQELYNTLIATGSLSATDALEVGVMIEERDIADLQVTIQATTDADVTRVLQRLLNGSENHLRAFNNRLG
jgi:hypothetical protein